MQAFGGLWSLPDDDPFWTTDEEPLPAEQGDYVKVYPQPGWVVTANDGEVQLFNAGSVKNYGAKYGKFVYGTRHPFNVGLSEGSPAPDNMLSLYRWRCLGPAQSCAEFCRRRAGLAALPLDAGRQRPDA